MKSWILLLAGAYGLAALLDGIRGVAILAGIGVAGTAVMFGADALHEWRSGRAARRAVFRRWNRWEVEDELRRHGWRR